MIKEQDRIIGIALIENTFSFVNDDKRTKVCACDIANFLDEYYCEMFENIANDDNQFEQLKYELELASYYSFTELAEDYLADYNTVFHFDPLYTLAQNYGYDNIDDFLDDYAIIEDVAIDGIIVFQ